MRNSTEAPPPPAQESGGLRYYTSPLLLRVLATDAYDPQGASFAPFGSTEHAPFLSVAEPHLVPPLLLRAPALVVVPPEGSSAQTHHETRGVFTVLPAEGFVKEPGQPVYYNDPIQLMDQRGRLLGVVARAPFAGHLAADGHGGALVFVFERHTSRLQAIGDKFLRNEARRSMSVAAAPPVSSSASGSDASGGLGSVGPPSTTGAVPHRRASLVQVCGGERLRIPGLTRVVKKNYPGGCIMQPKLEDTGRSRSNGRNSLVDDEPPYLTCEVVLTTPPPSSLKRSESESSTASSTTSSASKKGAATQIADRTATGEFVGVLHSGVLHRRSDHMKIWKKRFFVLTQVALHRFDAHETLQSVRTTQKARGSIYLKDCRGVRYERFSRPHELEIELNNGKVFSLHSVDALTCSDWASVLSRAIENPHWVHAERSYLTVWRSDAQFESPQCPAITKVVLRHGRGKILGCVEPKMKPISTAPQWSEKLSLGHVKANGFLLVQLADGSVFRLTLEDLTRSLIQPRWIAVSTSLEVARISALEGDEDDVPRSLSNEVAQRKSDVIADEKSRFLVRLKFQADLQMDRRLTKRSSHEFERRVVLVTFSSLVMLPAIGYSYVHSIDAWARSLCVISSALLVVGIVAVAPVAWYMYLWMRYGHSMEGELHWFLTLLALEVRPHHDDISDRMSISSGEDSRSRVDSFANGDEENEIDDGAIVVPTKTPLYGLEKLQHNGRSSAVLSPQAIRTFRLENALDSILGRPVLSFFAIKQFFPNQFLQRDEKGRRVMLISLNNVNRKGLISHNVSGFNVLRYFLYLWEFIWSYQDMQEGVSQSQLVLVVDCLGWQYYKWFSIECQIMVQLLNQTHRYYPGRLARVIFVRDQASFGVYGKLLGKGLDPALRDIVEKAGTLEPFAHKLSDITRSTDETALHDFVSTILATHANIAIPSFTRRELEQAARFTTTGSLKADEDQPTLDSIGTRAVVLPSCPETFEWITVMNDKGFTMWRAKDASVPAPVAGKTYQSDSRASQWRGRFAMNTRNADRVMQLLKDPKLTGAWMEDTDKVVQLEMLSRQEDVCFWSRRVPFMNFSRSGHRGDSIEANHVQTNAFFHCVMRRIQDVRKGLRPHDRVSTMMWKTTSAQQVVVDRPATSDGTQGQGQIQWRKLEDPFVSLCFVVEEQAGTGLEEKTITLSFWFQSFSPPTTPKQDTEIAKLIARKFRALDAAVSLASTQEIKR